MSIPPIPTDLPGGPTDPNRPQDPNPFPDQDLPPEELPSEPPGEAPPSLPPEITDADQTRTPVPDQREDQPLKQIGRTQDEARREADDAEPNRRD